MDKLNNFKFEKFFFGDEKCRADVHRRIATANMSSPGHGAAIFNYFEMGWLTGSTPIYTNSGVPTRGLPISCYVNSMPDDMIGIIETWKENAVATCKGGGVGTYIGDVRPMGSLITNKGTSSGIIPFMKVNESIVNSVSQGGLRRGSGAIYLPIWHPEIESFIKIRKAELGSELSKTPFLHHGICIDDKFMNALMNGLEYDLHYDGVKTKKVLASVLWKSIIAMRLETGEPYILFIDNVNDNRCINYQRLGLKVTTSNLCSEILLHTGLDHLDNVRSAICCLSSINLAKYDEWKNDDQFIYNVYLYLDNVLENFLKYADPVHMKNFIYAVRRERSVGLSVMGFHTYCQKHNVIFGSEESRYINIDMFRHIKTKADEANEELGDLLGPCLDSIDAGTGLRFSNTISLAPTYTVSNILNVSPTTEPWSANLYAAEMSGNKFTVRNEELFTLLLDRGVSEEEITTNLLENNGSACNIPQLTEHEREVFKIGREIDQSQVIQLACDRVPYIDQGQSVNLFVGHHVTGQEISDWHIQAWSMGLKSMYYVRGTSNNHDTKLKLVNVTEVRSEKSREPSVKNCSLLEMLGFEACETCQ